MGNKHGGDPPQANLAGENAAKKAEEEYEDRALDAAKTAQAWADAAALRDVRLGDLRRVHAHRPFDEESAARVAREAAKALEAADDALAAKQAAKRAQDAAWARVRNFEGETPVRPLIPDEQE